MSDKIKVGDSVWHPCSMDIIEHKVVSITQYENFVHYHTKAVRNVGACGRLEVILHGNEDNLTFVELVDDDLPYASGLQDFVEGKYYIDQNKARLMFYRLQESLAYNSVSQWEQRLKEAKERYEKLKVLIKNIKEQINESIIEKGNLDSD
jgi:MFS superfamily sulfate permease-like transporter